MSEIPKSASTIISVIEPSWKKCLVCQDEFALLNDSGLCRGCDYARSEDRAFLARLGGILGGQKAVEDFTLANYQVTPGTAEALKAIQAFDPEKDNLYLWGSCGVGKTHLSCALARKFITKRAVEALFIKPPELMRKLRLRDPEDEEDEIRRMASMRVFVLDDLGVGKATEFALQVLYEILDRRDMNKRNGLVITSNLSPEDLSKRIGDDRLPSRIFGLCKVIQLVGEDRRIKK